MLDPSFGAGGKVLTDFGALSFAEAMAVQKDGKIVTGGLSFAGGVPGPFGIPGNFALARYGRDGSLDSSFGTDGKVLTDLGGDDDVSALALQCNGKIVVAGFSDAGGTFDFALARYLK